MHLFAITIGNHSPNRMDLVPNKVLITKKKEKKMDPRTDRQKDKWICRGPTDGCTDKWTYK